MADKKKDQINDCYVLIHSLVICIGMYQFGYGLASWGNLEMTFSAINDWDESTE